MDYLEGLNAVQRQAVECTDGAVMIVAGAGSGKTRVLTYRIVHLMNKGVDAFNILALTFTNKAAREMKDRIGKLVGNREAKNLWMGTFHSVFARILRSEAEKLGYPTNFTTYDTDDSKSLIKTILKEQGLDEKIYKPSSVLGRISSAKNNLMSVTAYNNNAQLVGDDRMSGRPQMGKIYEIYQRRCFKAGAMDFDDLLYNTNILLRDHPDVLYKYQNKFRYIMVDEYQDTNFSQYVIIKQLAARFENICVVGDDAQSIYAFRGATIQNILNFEKDYPDLKTFKLEQNYRSTKNIVEAANKVIANNKEQLKKVVWTDNESGQRIRLIRALTDNEEGMQVASAIFSIKMNERLHNKHFAILYRTNMQSRALEEALRKRDIPYKIYGGLSFYQRKEIKDLLAYCRLTINNNDEESLKRVINYPTRGIGDTTVNKLIIAANDHNVSTWTVMENIADFGLGLNSGTIAKIDEFVTLIKSFSALVGSLNAFEMGQHIANHSGILRELYSDKTPEGVSRFDNIQELLNGMKEFAEEVEMEIAAVTAEAASLSDDAPLIPPKPTLDVFMQDIALLTDADNKDKDDKNADKVSLMTIHAAKGLEFPHVFIVGMEENLFPSQLSLNSRSDLEEERRLFYVALTRAEKQVTLSYALQRYRWGSPVTCEISRFVEEIDDQFIDYPEIKETSRQPLTGGYRNFQRREATSAAAEKSFPPLPVKKNLVKLTTAGSKAPLTGNSNLKDLQVGMRVNHEKFGLGEVVYMEGAYPDGKATVVFETAGQKQLLLKFAKLTLLAE